MHAGGQAESWRALPEQHIAVGGWARLGQGLTLWHGAEDTALCAVGTDVWLGSWAAHGDTLRAGVGLWTEFAAALSSAGAHHIRLFGRAAPGVRGAGFLTEWEGRASLDFLLSGRLGLMLGPYVRWNRGKVQSDAWSAGLALGYGAARFAWPPD